MIHEKIIKKKILPILFFLWLMLPGSAFATSVFLSAGTYAFTVSYNLAKPGEAAKWERRLLANFLGAWEVNYLVDVWKYFSIAIFYSATFNLYPEELNGKTTGKTNLEILLGPGGTFYYFPFRRRLQGSNPDLRWTHFQIYEPYMGFGMHQLTLTGGSSVNYIGAELEVGVNMHLSENFGVGLVGKYGLYLGSLSATGSQANFLFRGVAYL